MKLSYIILIFILLSSCSNQKKVFWCGDHACKNNKEKEVFFKKNMTVEIKIINKSENKKESNLIDQILAKDKKYKKNKLKSNKKTSKELIYNEKKALEEEKKLIEQSKIDEQKRVEEEKELVKQIILEEKKLKKQEKLTKQTLLEDEKDIIVEPIQEKTNTKESDQNLLKNSSTINENSNDEFNVLVKKINDKNLIKPFPNINDIPK